MTIFIRQQNKDKSNCVAASTSNGQKNIHSNLIASEIFLLVKVPTQKANIHYRYVTYHICVDNDIGEILVTILRSVRNITRKFKLLLNRMSYICFGNK